MGVVRNQYPVWRISQYLTVFTDSQKRSRRVVARGRVLGEDGAGAWERQMRMVIQDGQAAGPLCSPGRWSQHPVMDRNGKECKNMYKVW